MLVVIRAYFYFAICYSFPHNQGLLGINVLVLNVCVMCAKGDCLKPGCLSDDQIGDWEVVWKQGRIGESDTKVFLHLT